MRGSEFFRAGERVGVAVSGGPDSVLLLEFIERLAREMGFLLAVVHFNHHLRGPESDADEEFVSKLARDRGLKLLRGGADVAQVAREKRRNLEATARDLRYQFFFSLVNQGRLTKVVTAHSANDQAETVLLRLLRGTGTRGLGGIYPVLEGKVVRPFLSLTRAAIEEDLKKRNLEFRIDPTNLDPKLRRNKIRLQLLPLLQREFNPEVITLLKDLADRAREDDAYLEERAREHTLPWRVREGNEEKIPVRPLLEFPPALARRALRQVILAARGTLYGITHQHIEALLRFSEEAQSGRTLVLPGGLMARKQFDWLILAPHTPEPPPSDFSYPVEVPGEVYVPQLGTTFRFKIVGPEQLRKAYNGSEKGALDALKLSSDLRLRNWHAGDCFRPSGSRKVWKLKELFRQRKIPSGQRRLWPVLESGKEIVWVRGFPPAYPGGASPDSSDILFIEEESPTSR
jgi:tRNA(Ile)-lysidine synthase